MTEERENSTPRGKKLLAAVLLAALLCALAAKPAWYLWQEISFPWKEHTQAEWTVKAYAEEKGIFYARYPRSLIDLLERNPETEAFVLNYPFREEKPVDLSGYSREQGIPLFLQWDPQWGYEKYGSDFLAITGCGPTCLSMAAYGLTGREDLDPAAVAAFAEKNGYYAEGYGSSWTLISQGAGKLGLNAKELPLVKKKITTALEEGKPVILAMGPGDFTTTGHYILLWGVEEGGYRVNDPNSPENSGKLWTYEQLESQIRNIWAISVEEE